MNHKLHGLYGLKWNPFLPDVPVEGLFESARVRRFRQRVEAMVSSGGFALVSGEPGSGKSVVMRQLQRSLSENTDVIVAVLTRPQGSVFDFYRELGGLFGVQLSPSNRYAGAKVLRERWVNHVELVGVRAILIVDEAQETKVAVLNEIRLLCSWMLDSKLLLGVILAGDGRLIERLRRPDLLPLGSRIRLRLPLESLDPEQLSEVLLYVLTEAGNPDLLSGEVRVALCEHAAGNLRVMMNLGAELLEAGVQEEVGQIDGELFFRTFESISRTAQRGGAKNRRMR